MRKKNSIINFITNFLPYFFVAILGFVRVKVFLYGLGESLSSLNQVFNNIFAYLAIAESGIGLFIGQKYYKLLIDNNYKQINKNYKASKVFFNSLALVIVALGFVVSFFLQYITNNDLNTIYMQIVFMLFLLKNSVDFFMYAPKMIINADQKMYKVNILINIAKIVEIVSEILLIKLGYDYIVLLCVGFIVRILFNLIINKKIFKLYPWLNDKEEFSKDFLKGAKNIIYQKISGLINNNTDVLLISAFLNPTLVIVYTSYNYITKYIDDITFMMMSSVQPSLGNALYKENKSDSYNILNQINVLFFFIASICTSLVIILINPFISLWVGDKYVIGEFGKYLFGILLFIKISNRTMLTVKDNLGYFKETKNILIIEAILNVLISVLLVNKFGIIGVLIGTIVSTTLTSFWKIPKFVINTFFEQKSIKYFVNYFISFISFMLITYVLDSFTIIQTTSYMTWLCNAVLYSILVLLITFIEYYILFPDFKNVVHNLKEFRNK